MVTPAIIIIASATSLWTAASALASGFPEGLGSFSQRFRLNQTPDKSVTRKRSLLTAILDTGVPISTF
jgi:hypothetical protein